MFFMGQIRLANVHTDVLMSQQNIHQTILLFIILSHFKY